ncbi:hypothetical protein FRB98_003488 [Tulasnella sp. 332]|nr:hypothetical protein FRB98_003488 [Tulasnella sp. 332]
MKPTAKPPGKRKARSPVPESDEENNLEEALTALQASGESFLQSFELNPFIPTSSDKTPKGRTKSVPTQSPDDDGWGGIEEKSAGDSDLFVPPLPKKAVADKKTVHSSSIAVAFSDPAKDVTSQSSDVDKQAAKALMSSKVSKIFAQPLSTGQDEPPKDTDAEKSLEHNDKALHRLLHTQLLAGFMSTELEMTPAERRRALQGRVLELSGSARLGDGLKVLRHDYKAHQPKGQRDLLSAKEKKIDTTRRVEAAENGMYHPDFKKSLFLQKKAKRRGIDRGIGTGIGRYKDGQLTLSRSDIESVIGSTSGRGGRRSGGGRGRGGGQKSRGHGSGLRGRGNS